MLPICYPSSPSPTTGLPEAVAYALSSVSGLTRWVDYIPVKLVGSPLGMNEQTTNLNGFVPMRLLGSAIGMNAWRDYIPVYVDNSATEAWVTSATGYIPYANSVLGAVAPSVPSFYFNFSNPSNVTLGAAQARGTITSTQNAVIAARVSPSRTTGVAPLYVNFDATATTSTLSTNPSHELFYATDFGDYSAGTWANGVQSSGLTSKNAGYGPVTGHVYETPGTYTVQMVVTDGVNTATKTGTIVVQDPNTVYAGTDTICISHSNNFTGAPSGATQVNTAGNTDMSAAFNTYKASNKRILFCKADAWTCTAPCVFNNLSGLTISGYGNGAAASFGSGTLVNVAASNFNSSVFAVYTGNSDLRICNFKIAVNSSISGNTVSTADAASVNSTMSGMLFYKVEIRGCSQGWNVVASQNPTSVVPDQVCLYECLVDELFGTPFIDFPPSQTVELHGGISAYVGMTRGGMMGCYFDSCNHGEQTLRFPYLDRAHINNNYIARCNQAKNPVKIHSVIHAYFPVWTEKFIISANVISTRNGYSYNGTTTTQTINSMIGCGNGGNGGVGGEWVRNGIIENNYAQGCLGYPKGFLQFAAIGCPNMTLRNNIADFSVGDRVSPVNTPYGSTELHFAEVTTSTSDVTTGVRIYNNTLYSNLANADNASFVIFLDSGAPELSPSNITIKNNIWYLPNHVGFKTGVTDQYRGPGGVPPLGPAIDIVTSNNTTNVSTPYTSPNFVTMPPLALTDWRPNTGSYAIAGIGSPITLRDFNNVTRVGTFNHIGAVLP